MKVIFKKKFAKQYNKLPTRVQDRFNQRLDLFLANQTHPTLNTHQLTGELSDCWSFNVTGDYRAVYTYEDEMVVIMLMIGTHSQLY